MRSKENTKEYKEQPLFLGKPQTLLEGNGPGLLTGREDAVVEVKLTGNLPFGPCQKPSECQGKLFTVKCLVGATLLQNFWKQRDARGSY